MSVIVFHYAASATVKDATIFQIREKILTVLAEKVIPRRTAADLMASPVRHATVENTMTDIHYLLTRYNINAVPVFKNSEAVGIITRQVVEKALFHGLGNESVEDYMNTDFDTIGPGEGIERVQGGREEDIPAEGILTRRKVIHNLMRELLPDRVFNLLAAAGEVAERIGMKAYVVGGFVRDLVMRNHNLDVDIVLEGDGIAFSEAFSQEYPCRVRPHHKFGTAVLVFPDGYKVDVATARVEYYQEPAALPIVEYSSLKLALYRRGVTINTLGGAVKPGGVGG